MSRYFLQILSISPIGIPFYRNTIILYINNSPLYNPVFNMLILYVAIYDVLSSKMSVLHSLTEYEGPSKNVSDKCQYFV